MYMRTNKSPRVLLELSPARSHNLVDSDANATVSFAIHLVALNLDSLSRATEFLKELPSGVLIIRLFCVMCSAPL